MSYEKNMDFPAYNMPAAGGKFLWIWEVFLFTKNCCGENSPPQAEIFFEVFLLRISSILGVKIIKISRLRRAPVKPRNFKTQCFSPSM